MVFVRERSKKLLMVIVLSLRSIPRSNFYLEYPKGRRAVVPIGDNAQTKLER